MTSTDPPKAEPEIQPQAPPTPPAASATTYNQPRSYLVTRASLIAWGICTVLLCILCVFIGLQISKHSPMRNDFQGQRTFQYHIRPSTTQ